MASFGTWPAALWPRSCRLVSRSNTRANAAPGGGSEQVVDLLNDRWLMELVLPMRRPEDAARIEAFLNSMRGMFNTVDVFPFHRPRPQGTLSGTIQTSGSTAQGASSIVLSGGTNGQTLKAGDFFGAGSQLFQAAADATVASGTITVTLANRVRTAISNGAAVTLTRPTIPFRLLSSSGVQYLPGYADQVSVSLGEVIS